MYVLSAENMKKAEEKAVENGKTWHGLMETAGTECAKHISKEDKSRKTVILCGKGRNGGDGFVIARKLWQYGFRSIFVITVYPLSSDELCLEMYDEMRKYPVNVCDFANETETCLHHISTAEVLVDAVFGIGFRGELQSNAAECIRTANKNKTAKKYAVDIPSGLTAEGNEPSLFFETDETLTMIALKPVQVLKPYAGKCGKTTVMDIGIENSCLEPFCEDYSVYTKEDAISNITKRSFDAHKGNFGNVLTICGSKNMTGCVYLCNQACVEIGAGLVTACFPDCIYDTVTPKLTEPLMLPISSNKNGRIKTDSKILTEKLRKADVVAIGPGLGTDNDTKDLVRFIITTFKGVLILDADAINCIATNPDILKDSQCDIVLTPHPGEMSRLTGLSVAEIQKDRMKIAKAFAAEYRVTLLLKGADTVVADKNGKTYINTTGNPSMARGGSGDVLTGLVAGLAMQTSDTFTAVCTAAYIHGGTADFVAKKYGSLSATPSRIIENIHKYLSK